MAAKEQFLSKQKRYHPISLPQEFSDEEKRLSGIQGRTLHQDLENVLCRGYEYPVHEYQLFKRRFRAGSGRSSLFTHCQGKRILSERKVRRLDGRRAFFWGKYTSILPGETSHNIELRIGNI